MATPLIFQTLACKMENGKNGGSQSGGWGAANSPQALGAGNAIPYLSLETNPDFGFKEDDSITTTAFAAHSRIVSKNLSKTLSFYDRYYGQDNLNYWMFGFENEPMQVVAFDGVANPWSATAPAAGAVYVDGSLNEFTYLRQETKRNTDGDVTYLYIFRNDDDVLPATSGTLTLSGDTETFTYTGRSGDLYEHLYELDSYGRRMRAYNTAEQAITGWESGDLKNLMMTIGRRLDAYDQRIQNAMCKSWSWKLSAGDLAMYECGYLGYKLTKGDYSSDTWTLPTGLENNFSVPPAHETQFKLGTIFEGVSSDMVSLGMTESNLTCEIPLDETQDYLSGVNLSLPIINAKYALTMTSTISRHDQGTYEDLRDANTIVCAQIISNMGYYMKEFLIKGATITQSGPDSSPVAQEPLNLSIGYVPLASSPFTSTGHLYGITEIHNSPILLRVRNESAVNQMFAN